jgi:hypothetical protein
MRGDAARVGHRMNRGLLALLAAAALLTLCQLVLSGCSYSRPTVHFVSDAERQVILQACTTAAGFSTFTADPIENQTLTQSERDGAIKYQVAESVCAAKNPPDPSKYSLMGKEQRSYLYDYYVRWLLPCLESSGYRLADAPSRKTFIGDWLKPGWWSPYDSIGNPPSDAMLARVQDKCPPRPPGLD